MGEHRQKEGLPAILLLLERVRVIKSAHLEGINILEYVKLLESVLKPHVSVVGLVEGRIKGIHFTLGIFG